MATHSSILAWKIPWTQEPGRLQTTGSQRVRHDSFTLLGEVYIGCLAQSVVSNKGLIKVSVP